MACNNDQSLFDFLVKYYICSFIFACLCGFAGADPGFWGWLLGLWAIPIPFIGALYILYVAKNK